MVYAFLVDQLLALAANGNPGNNNNNGSVFLKKCALTTSVTIMEITTAIIVVRG